MGLALFFSYSFTVRLSRCHASVGPQSACGCFLHRSAPAANRLAPHPVADASPPTREWSSRQNTVGAGKTQPTQRRMDERPKSKV